VHEEKITSISKEKSECIKLTSESTDHLQIQDFFKKIGETAVGARELPIEKSGPAFIPAGI